MVTYSELIQLGLLLIAIIRLVIDVTNKKK